MAGTTKKALVLAGGKGTRLRPLTHTLPKVLVPIANRPVLHYVIDHILGCGISEIGIIVSPETSLQIRESLSVYPNTIEFTFLIQQEPLGLAHTVQIAHPFLGNDPFVMFLGDNLIGQEISTFVQYFEESEADALVLLKEVPDPRMFGVAVTDKQQRIVKLVEKPEEPTSNLALVGVYMFDPSIHEAVRAITPSLRGELEITDAIQYLLENGYKVLGKKLDGWWLDCGKKDDLLKANRVVLGDWSGSEVRGQVNESSRLSGHVVVGEGSTILNSEVMGPVIVGEGSIVEDSFLGPHTSIGSSCHITESTLENSILLDNVQVHGVSRMEESVIGQHSIVRLSRGEPPVIRLMIGDNAEVLA